MHTFGHPVQLDELAGVAKKWGIPLVEDAAESLGSLYKGTHTGTIGQYGALSFNGNKTITTGGGGAILCSTEKEGKRIKHLTSTAKVPHPYEFIHDEPGFNFRMPNLNAALGCAQLEALDKYLINKRYIAEQYKDFFSDSDISFFHEPDYAKSNYWLNAIICNSPKQRDEILKKTNDSNVMSRPVWRLMHKLPMFSEALRGDLSYSEKIEKLLVNLPSSPFCFD
jgi:predicted outer membrane repeat protein